MSDSAAKQHAADVLRYVRAIDAPAEPRPSSRSAHAAASWRGALNYSLDPSHQPAPPVIDARTFAERRAQLAPLVHVAAAEIEWLYEYIGEPGHALILTDSSGLVLFEKADSTLCDTLRAAGLVVGADWSEQCSGVGATDTCHAGHLPNANGRNDHFRPCQIGLSCSGAPIHDPSGALVARLDACTMNAAGNCSPLAHTMTLVSSSARLIEKCLFLRHFQNGAVFRFHAWPELVGLQQDGALALAGDATVLAVDEAAIRLLGAASRSELIGRHLDEVFDVRTEELIDPARGMQPALRPVRDRMLGRRFFASLDHGTANAPAPSCRARTSEPPNVMQFAPVAERRTPLTLEELAGEDPQMLRNVRSAHRIAVSRVPVMIQGPTGAGKEMFARALHAASDRASQQFVALNCAAIPESLIESELFGYRSGAFTGARKEGMKGKILQSSGGTLFLDEIGDMPLPLQTRLLRVLEEQEVVPLGTETPLKVDLRVISASHQNLRAMISRGEFREDLYYRLNGITLELPPLVQRTDRERLIREFLAAETRDGRPAAIEVDAFQCLLAYSWPGNIRELRNVIRTALAICDGGVVRLKDLPSEVRTDAANEGQEPTRAKPADPVAPIHDAEAAVEREHVLCAIHDSNGNMSRAARLLGVSRNTLYRRCKRLGIALHRSSETAL